MSSEYQSVFFIVPSKIMNLPDLILSYLRVYETIFQFWNKGKQCYLSNEAIMERTGIKSESTIRQAFAYFEKHNVLKRKTVKGKRYLIQPEQIIEIDPPVDKNKNVDKPVAKSTPPRRQVDAPPVAKSTHNNKNLNKEINRATKSKKLALISEKFYPDQENQKLCDMKAAQCGMTGMQLLTKFIFVQLKYKTKSDDFNVNFKEFIDREVSKDNRIKLGTV